MHTSTLLSQAPEHAERVRACGDATSESLPELGATCPGAGGFGTTGGYVKLEDVARLPEFSAPVVRF